MEETFNSWLLYVVDWTCKRLSEYTSKKGTYMISGNRNVLILH